MLQPFTNRILAATDFSEYGELAVRQARAVARHTSAELVVAHACNVSESLPDAYQRARGIVEPFREQLQQAVRERRERLVQLVARLDEPRLRVSHRILDGPPVDAVCDAVSDEQIDLVIVGTHGRAGFERVRMGSVAERVVRRAGCSAMVAREPIVESPGFQHILVPTDFSRSSREALRAAVDLAAPEAVINVVHFWELPPLARAAGDDVRKAMASSIQGAAKKAGAELMAEHQDKNLALSFHCSDASAVCGIQELLDDAPVPFDLVAMGTHGLHGVKRVQLGSVAEATVRYSPCSVLVTRGRG